jgi:leucyl/phenylalanyl-tRNA--protein transferase
VFFGESMFTRVTDASKVALVHAVAFLRTHGVELIDCQVASAHTVSLGAVDVPRVEFLERLSVLCRPPALPQAWRAP